MTSEDYIEDLVYEYLDELSGRQGAYMFTATEEDHDVIHRKVLGFMTTELEQQGVCVTLETEKDFMNLLAHINPSKVHFINKYDERAKEIPIKITFLEDENSIDEISEKIADELARLPYKFVVIKSLDQLFRKNHVDDVARFVEQLIKTLNEAGISVITIAKGQQMTSNLVTKTKHNYDKTVHL